MIVVPVDLRIGDHVYLSWSPSKMNVKESLLKKKKDTDVAEYIITFMQYDKTFIRFHSVLGDYDMTFTKENLENFTGTCTKTS